MTLEHANMPHCVSRPRPSSVFGRSSRAPPTASVGTFICAPNARRALPSPKSQCGGEEPRRYWPAELLDNGRDLIRLEQNAPFSHRSSMSMISTLSGGSRADHRHEFIPFWRLASSMLRKPLFCGRNAQSDLFPLQLQPLSVKLRCADRFPCNRFPRLP